MVKKGKTLDKRYPTKKYKVEMRNKMSRIRRTRKHMRRG